MDSDGWLWFLDLDKMIRISDKDMIRLSHETLYMMFRLRMMFRENESYTLDTAWSFGYGSPILDGDRLSSSSPLLFSLMHFDSL